MSAGNPDPAALRAEFCAAKEAFDCRAAALGHGDLSLYFWYHTIDLGDGLVTPGSYDYRQTLADYGFPEDMRGLKVLDVGAATGFFAFEFERRGADVTALELPRLEALDLFPGENTGDMMRKFEELYPHHSAHTREQLDFIFRRGSPADFYHYLLDAPFLFCRKALGSSVRRRHLSIYDLSPLALPEAFDIVFLGDVLLHLLDPVKGLAAAAGLCRDRLIISQPMSADAQEPPLMHYTGGSTPGKGLAWWLPNYRCFEQLLLKLGFASVHIAGRHSDMLRPAGVFNHSLVLHACRGASAAGSAA